MADLAPPDGWETPARTLDNMQPVAGPDGGEQIAAMLPGADQGAGTRDTIGGTVAEAESLSLASNEVHQRPTLTQGNHMGALVPLPEGPDSESSELGSIA